MHPHDRPLEGEVAGQQEQLNLGGGWLEVVLEIHIAAGAVEGQFRAHIAVLLPGSLQFPDRIGASPVDLGGVKVAVCPVLLEGQAGVVGRLPVGVQRNGQISSHQASQCFRIDRGFCVFGLGMRLGVDQEVVDVEQVDGGLSSLSLGEGMAAISSWVNGWICRFS